MMRVPVGVSNRHIHLSQIDAEKLFGKGYEFRKIKDLSQPGQFACEESVSIKGPKGQIDRVRFLGPIRKQTQVEILASDNHILGIDAPLRLSGDLEGTESLTIIGPAGTVYVPNCAIVAERHIHMSVAQAQDFGFKNNQVVDVEVNGDRAVIFKNVKIRVHDSFDLDFHIDMDEGNATGLKTDDRGTILD